MEGRTLSLGLFRLQKYILLDRETIVVIETIDLTKKNLLLGHIHDDHLNVLSGRLHGPFRFGTYQLDSFTLVSTSPPCRERTKSLLGRWFHRQSTQRRPPHRVTNMKRSCVTNHRWPAQCDPFVRFNRSEMSFFNVLYEQVNKSVPCRELLKLHSLRVETNIVWSIVATKEIIWHRSQSAWAWGWGEEQFDGLRPERSSTSSPRTFPKTFDSRSCSFSIWYLKRELSLLVFEILD